MKNEDILRGMLESNEQFYWQVTGSIRDWKYNPFNWILAVCTLGLYLWGLHLYRTYRYYVLTSSRFIIISGILGRQVDEIELFRIVDSKTVQSLVDRWADLGTIIVSSTDKTGIATMKKIPEPHLVRDSLRQTYMKARNARGTVVLEQS